MNKNNNTEDMINVKGLLFSLIAQWKLIALCTFLSLIAALLYLRTAANTYMVDALVQIEENKGVSAALLGDLSDVVGQMSSAQAEIEILTSRLILGSVIERLNLDIRISSTEDTFSNRLFQHPNYRTEYQPQSVRFKDGQKSFDIRQFEIPAAYLDKNLLLKFQQQGFSLTNPETEEVVFQGALNRPLQATSAQSGWKIVIFTQNHLNASYRIQKQSLPAAINSILANFSVDEKGKLTGILRLRYQGHDKQYITQILNAILTAYSQQNIERRSAETAQTLKFLDGQLPDLKKQLDDAEDVFNQFRQQYNTVDISKESELYLNQSISLETQKAVLEQKQAEMAAKYTVAHPAMREINAQLSVINGKVRELNNTLKRLPELQRQYLQLSREVEVKQQLYTNLVNSYQQLHVAKAGEIGNVRIIDTAIAPIEQIKPKKSLILVLALLSGVFLGILLALFRYMLQSGVKDSSQIESELELPVYATIAHSPIQKSGLKLLKKKKAPFLLAIKDSNDIAIESLRSIRTAIHFALTQAKNNIIMISGPAPKVGKSFVSSNLAVIMAEKNKRVLIIDADLRRGHIHKYFDLNNQYGLTEYLNEQTTLKQMVQNTKVPNLSVITCGKSPANPSELLNSARFHELLQQLIPYYDHIIIDTAPVLAVTDAIIVSQHAGINLVVARYAKTQMKELELTLNRFKQAGNKVNGFILNDIQRSAGGSYSYDYTYSYKTRLSSLYKKTG
ncbi:polysaccharide biosynthesis tyrosine autokinase [Acinetobacter terrestris]|uniref:polysaccharide biosynthesis tyrosine autokinase n=1 Tax=Acinetobacter terrestris TaxID=2529843 RepID=UPI00103CC6C3|nr:polysaccharide biosynthesis tyrosine autokinase [Acinetobacter terrestris]TCB46565.1 polysaccharide biosynthesis tyrosine autokinase [Acinetobacter terrestris]